MAHGALTNQLQCHPRSNFKGSRRLTKPQPRLELKLGWAWQNWTANPRYLSRWISKHIYWQKIKKGYLWVVKLKNPSSFHHESSPPLNFFRMRLGFSIGLFYKCQGALWNRMSVARIIINLYSEQLHNNNIKYIPLSQHTKSFVVFSNFTYKIISEVRWLFLPTICVELKDCS